MFTPYKCCPEGVHVDIEGLATGKIGSVFCFACGRAFIGANQRAGNRVPGDVFVHSDGKISFETASIRKLRVELSEWANMLTGDPNNSVLRNVEPRTPPASKDSDA